MTYWVSCNVNQAGARRSGFSRFLRVLAIFLVVSAPAAAALPDLEDPLGDPSAGEEAEEYDASSRVAALGYHRFGPRSADSLLIGAGELEQQIQTLRQRGLAFISMDEFLAWRAGESNIPANSVLVTIDDGYRSIYDYAHPVFQKLDVPCTIFVYTNYIENGRAAITWPMLRELRDAGVTIASHGKSHARLAGDEVMAEHGADEPTVPPLTRDEFFSRTTLALSPMLGGAPQLATLAEWAQRGLTRNKYEEWVWNELTESKRVLEENLQITVRTLSYPYGVYSDRVAQLAQFAGYEAMFTVNGDEITALTPMDELHRYIIHSDDSANFDRAARFRTASAEPEADPPLPEGVIVSPAKNAEVAGQTPLIEVRFDQWEGTIDPESLRMRISGIGIVPADWIAGDRRFVYQPEAPLHNRSHTVVVTGKTTDGESFRARWSFFPQPARQDPAQSTESVLLDLRNATPPAQ